MAETLAQIEFTPEEIRKLPAALRRKIEAAFGPIDKVSGDWTLVGAKTPGLASLVDLTIAKLPAVAAAHAEAVQEANIEKLLEVFAANLPRAAVEADLELDNAELRAQYLAETPLLTAADIRKQSGLTPRNKSEPASRWKREGKLFAVRKGGADHFPAFQFAQGEPKPVIKKVLAVLPNDLTPWQVAFWFASGNGWLDGDAPQTRLDDPDAVVAAAKRLADPAIG